MKKIQLLTDIHTESGNQFLQRLFTQKLTISEKINGNAFSVSFFDNGNDINFYKNNRPITKIDRLVVRLYDDPIEYFEKILPKVKELLRGVDYRFCFEYFSNSLPQTLLQSTPKKMKLVLTHIIDKSSNAVIVDKEKLDYWADVLGVMKPFIIYQGILSAEEKDAITTYITNGNRSDINNDSSFIKHLLSLLNSSITQKLMSLDNTQDFDNIYFSFYDENDKQTYCAKLVSDQIDFDKQSIEIPQQKNDILTLIYADIIDYFFLHEEDVNKFMFTNSDVDMKYIEFMCHFFNGFYKENYAKYRNIYEELPEFTKKSEFDINFDYIENGETLKLISGNNDATQLLKLFIILFRRKKKNVKEFINPNLKKFQNELHDIIWNKINDSKHDTLQTESLDNTYLITEKAENVDIDNSLSAMRIVSFWQEFLTQEKKVKSSATKKIDIYIGALHFLTENIEDLLNNDKISILQIYNKNSYIPQHFYDKLFTVVKENYQNVHSYQRISCFDVSVLSELIDKYNINKIYCDFEYFNDVKLQIEYYKFKNKKDFKMPEVVELSKDDRLMNVESALKFNNYLRFKDLTMADTHIFFTELCAYYNKENDN